MLRLFSSGIPSEWKTLIDNIDEPSAKIAFRKFVTDFFIIDGIDPVKFIANFNVMKHGSRDIYSSSAGLGDEEDLSELATESIDQLAFIGNKPIGFTNVFTSAYPDVVKWVSELSEEEFNGLYGAATEDDLIDDEGLIRNELLRKIVDTYKSGNHPLECSHSPSN